MKGARDYACLFKTGQYGNLYFVSSEHARGKTFRIFILPDGEKAIPNGNNAPLNKDSVEVYGVIGGNLGWTEYYGWIYRGAWIEDFEILVKNRKEDIARKQESLLKKTTKEEKVEKERVKKLLSNYRSAYSRKSEEVSGITNKRISGATPILCKR